MLLLLLPFPIAILSSLLPPPTPSFPPLLPSPRLPLSPPSLTAAPTTVSMPLSTPSSLATVFTPPLLSSFVGSTVPPCHGLPSSLRPSSAANTTSIAAGCRCQHHPTERHCRCFSSPPLDFLFILFSTAAATSLSSLFLSISIDPLPLSSFSAVVTTTTLHRSLASPAFSRRRLPSPSPASTLLPSLIAPSTIAAATAFLSTPASAMVNLLSPSVSVRLGGRRLGEEDELMGHVMGYWAKHVVG